VLSKDRVRGWIVRTGAWGITVSLLLLAIPGPGWQAVRHEIRELKKSRKSQPSKVSSESTSKQESDSSESDKTILASVDSPAPESAASDTAVHPFYRGTLLGPYGSALALIAVGIFAGFYSVPLQVFLQSTAPSEQKGRIIGAVNLMNWIGIAGAGAVYSIGRFVLVDWLMFPYATLFAFASALMLPVALFYRPPDAQVSA
jgi:acyl-[acyl-carrier-protein]-phospholipid O-acyltransferase/long-chain-fatty-acid--[acyl-carrier-protein] ligase